MVSSSGTEKTLAAAADPLAATEVTEATKSSRTPGPAHEGSRLRRGAVLGRHVVVREVGAGGMGVVYAAYDPELDRKVALKLLLPGLTAGREARERLVREAQAMARLSHPNVVVIHDVGEHEGSVWLAMEFVDGVTLSAWLREKRRSWREGLEVLGAAGRGLAAAHAAGLLHRDFKPDNVMVGAEGRVRVMDLGLARASERSEDAEAARPGVEAEVVGDLDKLAVRVTQAGAVLGTPAYMAPEQFRGDDIDARADVFAYCVTLWEALYGRRPFSGESVVSLAANVLAGKIDAPPRDAVSRRVPRWLRRLCERGLAVDADRRPASMPELLAAVERGRRRARVGRVVVGVAALALVAGGVEGWRRWDEHLRMAACERDGAEIDAVWNDDTRRALREGLLATGVSYAPTTADKTIAYFDAQASRWRAVRTEVCLETRVQHTWAEELLDRASWCLEERRMELEALATELTRASATTVQKSVTAAAALGDVEPCRDGPRLRLLPGPPEERSGVSAVGRELSQAGALLAAGDYKRGLTVGDAALSRAQEVKWPPLVARAQRVTGKLLGKTGDLAGAEAMLADAYFGAAEAGEWGTAAEAATELVYTVGYRLARHADGRAWGRHAEVALSVIGETDVGLRRATLATHLGLVRESQSAYAEAKALHERALAIWEEALGPDHPIVATSLSNLGLVQSATGAYAEAKALHERALAIREGALGPDHPDVAMLLNNLANVYQSTGAHAEARALYERVLAIREEALGPDHPDVATALNNLADVHRMTGAYAEAKALYERALAIAERALGPDHLFVAVFLTNLAEVRRLMGAYAEARALHERALAIAEKVLDPNHPNLAYPLTGLAEVALAEGRPADALPHAERAVRIREAGHAAPEFLAHSRFILALTLWDAPIAAGRDRERALAEAHRARADARFAGGNTKELAEIEAWLAERERGGGP